MTVNRLRAILLILGFCFVLGGCAITEGSRDTARPLVVWATARAIQADPDPAARAAGLIAYARAAKTFLDGEPLSLSELYLRISEREALERLSPADRLFGDELMRLVVGELAVGVSQGAVASDRVYRANLVLDWIIAAAGAF